MKIKVKELIPNQHLNPRESYTHFQLHVSPRGFVLFANLFVCLFVRDQGERGISLKYVKCAGDLSLKKINICIKKRKGNRSKTLRFIKSS